MTTIRPRQSGKAHEARVYARSRAMLALTMETEQAQREGVDPEGMRRARYYADYLGVELPEVFR